MKKILETLLAIRELSFLHNPFLVNEGKVRQRGTRRRKTVPIIEG